MSHNHPPETDLALLAGGDCSSWRTFLLNRHLARCGDCRDILASYTELRSAVSDHAAPDVSSDGFSSGGSSSGNAAWDRLAAEMRANIRVGLAAGECVREISARPVSWNPRWALGTAGVLLLAGAGLFLRGLLPHETAPDVVHAAVVQSTGAGVEVRTGTGSMTLLNHGSEAGNQTVTSDGAIRASYVDGSTGTVTVTSVYVE
jgi:hypothetical protein